MVCIVPARYDHQLNGSKLAASFAPGEEEPVFEEPEQVPEGGDGHFSYNDL